MLTTPSLADRLRVSVGRLARRLRQQSAEDDLTLSQASVLATLERHGPLAMSEVAAHERISKPSATGIVGRLVDKGLVERAPDPDDARSSIVAITPEGLRLLNRRRRQRTEYLARRIDALDAGDRAVLERAVALLEKIVEDR
ncbi:MAG TPA: MarR family transcriptional regulator [Acidimicrobiia bacterium]|nr:MarR family transcriptional regulator [Acidimicrobiia bacterium]